MIIDKAVSAMIGAVVSDYPDCAAALRQIEALVNRGRVAEAAQLAFDEPPTSLAFLWGALQTHLEASRSWEAA